MTKERPTTDSHNLVKAENAVLLAATIMLGIVLYFKKNWKGYPRDPLSFIQ